KAATHPQELPDTPQVLVEPQGAAVEVSKWEPQDREIHVRVDAPSIVRLKTYNFPGWTARLDGQIVPMLSDKDGIQQIEVPPGIHKIQASFVNTPPRAAGTLLSVLALVLIVGLSIFDHLKGRKAAANKETGS
ncbi:MAG TPA: hypothetical protein VLG74_11170, partial [Blastocatellia bacterium]|nr:hypothetical protein [Blastocatellia bacterium]